MKPEVKLDIIAYRLSRERQDWTKQNRTLAFGALKIVLIYEV